MVDFQAGDSRRSQAQFSLLHLGFTVSLVAGHLFVARVAASSNDFEAIGLVLVYLLFTGCAVQKTLGLNWLQTAAILYPMSLIWAPFFGMTYSFFWNQHRGPWHLDALGRHIPSEVAWDCFEIMLLFLGPITSIVYGVCAWILNGLLSRLSPVHSSSEIDSPSEESEQ